MKRMLLNEVIRGVKGRCRCQHSNDTGDYLFNDLLITGISTDSRKVKKGDLFIPLLGGNFDGHDYIKTAVEKKAAAVISSRQLDFHLPVPLIMVPDTSQALLDLAGFYRQKFRQPVIAVTGSVGKTSTKDMIGAVLSSKLRVHKTAGNFNNDIGLPLTIFQFEEDHQVLVLEMGMRGLGEIRALTKVAEPSIAVITNIGIAHLERLGSQENILRAKMEIVEGLSGIGEKGILILNGNDFFLSKIKKKEDLSFYLPKSFPKDAVKKIITVAVEKEGDYTAYDLVNQGEAGVSFKVRLMGQEYLFHLAALGEHHVSNALCAIACGVELGLSPAEIVAGVASFHPEKLRCDIVERDEIKFINDSYNASPDSMKAALRILAKLAEGKRAVAVLGNIFELGEMAGPGHFEVGEMCRTLNVDFTAIMGENAEDVAQGIGDPSKYKIFSTHQGIVDYLKGYLQKDDVVLIKGSRGMKMEKILELW